MSPFKVVKSCTLLLILQLAIESAIRYLKEFVSCAGAVWPALEDIPHYLPPHVGSSLTMIRNAPKIYIYDIPGWSNCTADWRWSIYGAEVVLPLALRQAQIYVTTDPEQADYFYVNAQFYCTDRSWEGVHIGGFTPCT